MSLVSGVRSGIRSALRSGLNPSDAAAIPTYVAAGVAASGIGALTPGVPAGMAVGDIMILVVNNTHSTTTDATLTTANGFVAVATGAINSGAYVLKSHQTLFWKRAVGGDLDPVIADNGDFNVARIYAYRGCAAAGDPWDVISTDGDDDTDLTMTMATGATTTGANRLVCVFVTAFTGGAGSIASWTNADLATITERDDTSYFVVSEYVHIAHITGEKAAAGAYGATTATWSGSVYVLSAGITIALKP